MPDTDNAASKADEERAADVVARAEAVTAQQCLDAWREGLQACRDGVALHECPYPREEPEYQRTFWRIGHCLEGAGSSLLAEAGAAIALDAAHARIAALEAQCEALRAALRGLVEAQWVSSSATSYACFDCGASNGLALRIKHRNDCRVGAALALLEGQE